MKKFASLIITVLIVSVAGMAQATRLIFPEPDTGTMSFGQNKQ